MTTRGRRRSNASDAEQWTVSLLNGWIFLTHNRKDYILLQDAWERWVVFWDSQPMHAGVLIIPQAWLPDRASREVDLFVTTSSVLGNNLHEADVAGTWTHWTPPDL